MKKRIWAVVVALAAVWSMIPIAVSAESNVEIIYTYLTEQMGLNSAAACGVLANIEKESGFRPDALGDNGTSYGICQWHDTVEGQGRYTSLKNFCEGRGLDYTQLDGQLAYMEFELQNWYPKVWDALYSAENTPDGAYEAAYYWCYHYEVPANREEKAVDRGNLARDKYWPIYNEESPGIGKYEVWITDADPTLNVRTGPDTTYPKSDSLPLGTEIRVTEVVQGTTFLWGNTGAGWCVLDYCKYVSGALYTVEYNTNCTVSIEPQPKSVNAEVTIASADALTKYGHTFAGWATEPNGVPVYPPEGGTYTDNADLTLYGMWTRDTSIPLIAGDVNSDGLFDFKDVAVLIRYNAGYEVSADLTAADVTGDGEADFKDVALMLRKLAGWDVEIADPVETLPPEESTDTSDTSDVTDTTESTDITESTDMTDTSESTDITESTDTTGPTETTDPTDTPEETTETTASATEEVPVEETTGVVE